MNKWKTFFEFLRVWRNGRYIGDAVILKVATFGGFEPTEAVQRVLAAMPKKPPDFSKEDYSTFPLGSLGAEYQVFMKKNGLKPFGFSGKYQDLLEQHFFAVWYSAVHDLVHVLTGFDTTWAGEAGVWSFVAGQKISPQAERAVKLAGTLYPVFALGHSKKIREAVAAGYAMGEKATSIVNIDFHAELRAPLGEVRRRHQITSI